LSHFVVVEIDARIASACRRYPLSLADELADVWHYPQYQGSANIVGKGYVRHYRHCGQGRCGERLVDGLRRLEYRGYDSAGVCTVRTASAIAAAREGKLNNLAKELAGEPLARHRSASATPAGRRMARRRGNAHPHATGRVALVHNGIIENFAELRDELIARGRTPSRAETDTEVVAHLVSDHLEPAASPEEAVAAPCRGCTAPSRSPWCFAGTRRPADRRAARLAAGRRLWRRRDLSGLGRAGARAADRRRSPISRRATGSSWAAGRGDLRPDNGRSSAPVTASAVSRRLIDKGNHRHFMQKEISSSHRGGRRRCAATSDPAKTGRAAADGFRSGRRAGHHRRLRHLLYAGMVAKYWFEQFARVPVDIDVASEFRYRDPVLEERAGWRCSSRSRARRPIRSPRCAHAKERGQTIAAVVNVPTSTMAREADLCCPPMPGRRSASPRPRRSPASSRCWRRCLAMALAPRRGKLTAEEAEIVWHLSRCPAAMNAALRMTTRSSDGAPDRAKARDVLYLGRGPDYPMALEGALKLKEISYIHAEGYAAGEMKHGPIALIDEAVPVIVIAPPDGPLFEKTVSNMQEVRRAAARWC
jgi:glucosamine--fructose-6-phosphate aminotransferase (isomerizing)